MLDSRRVGPTSNDVLCSLVPSPESYLNQPICKLEESSWCYGPVFFRLDNILNIAATHTTILHEHDPKHNKQPNTKLKRTLKSTLEWSHKAMKTGSRKGTAKTNRVPGYESTPKTGLERSQKRNPKQSPERLPQISEAACSPRA